MNNNMSEWIAEAKKQGIDLSSFYQDKRTIYETLEKIPLTAKLNKKRELEWISDKKPREKEKKIIFKALSYIGGVEKPFPGY